MVSLIQIISALLNIITWLVIIDVVMSLLIQFRILDQRNKLCHKYGYQLEMY